LLETPKKRSRSVIKEQNIRKIQSSYFDLTNDDSKLLLPKNNSTNLFSLKNAEKIIYKNL